MTYKEWEKKLLKYLTPLPKEERDAAVEYYREMYGDKLDAGEPTEKILQEFGEPRACAERILNENGKTLPKSSFLGEVSVAWLVGMFFLTALLILPLLAVAISIIAAFASAVVAGAACAVGGAMYVVYSPFMALTGLGFGAVIAHMGVGFALCGVGALLFAAFIPLTKYSCKYLVKGVIYIYTRRAKA